MVGGGGEPVRFSPKILAPGGEGSVAMVQRVCNHTALLVVGMAIGAALTAGWHGLTTLPKAHAVATHGSDNFAIATGIVEDDVEALYFLDYLTGDLRGTIISRRNAAFTGYFSYNVLRDFDGVGDPPRFLLVTGIADIPRGRGNTQIGQSLVYIAEATTGQVAAYVMPFNSTLWASGAPQRGTFLLVAKGSFRDAVVRDQ